MKRAASAITLSSFTYADASPEGTFSIFGRLLGFAPLAPGIGPVLKRHSPWAIAAVCMVLLPGLAYAQLLPQTHQYQRDIYDWLETISIQDVTIPVGAQVTWDGTYANTDELARLWAETLQDGDNRRSFSAVSASRPEWYVLDDGQGHGIEGTGIIIRPRVSDPTGGSHGMASEAAWWYHWNIPKANGGQGNPLYKHPGMGNRALVLAAVELVLIDHCIQTRQPNCTENWGDRSDYIGGYLIAVADAYRWAGELLDSKTKAAFETGMIRLANRMLELGAHDINTNMDMKAVEGCALAYMAAPSNTTLRDVCIRVAKKILFGSENGSISNLNSDTGSYYLEGLIREADGPETTYNGRSFAHLAAARNITYGQSAWNFLDDIIPQMCDFMFYQFFQQPPGQIEDEIFSVAQTPDGYSNRTAGGMRQPQDTPWGNMTAAYLYPECRSMVWNWHWSKEAIPSASSLQNETQNRITAIGSVPQDATLPGEWTAKEPWPTITPFTPPASGWHAVLRGYVESNQYYHPHHPSRNASFSRTFPAANEAGNNWWDTEQWWARRAGSGTNEFGYFIEGTTFSGDYGGYYSGKIEGFWRENQGPIILGFRGSKEYPITDVEKLRIDHTWGRDENNRAFTWGRVNGDKNQSSSSARTVTWDAQAQRFTVVTPMENRGEETGNEITGSVRLTKIFTALSNGLEVTTQVDKLSGSDQVRELWHTLPIYQGGNGEIGVAPNSFAVQYWNGNSWATLSSSRVTTGKVRIGHNYGSGFVYSYITFTAPQSVRLLAPDTSVDGQRVHLLQIDLHGNPGTNKTIPASTSVTYAITTTDSPGNPPPPVNQSPSVTLTAPSGGATFPASSNITLTASASDADGSVAKVEFFRGSTKLGEDTNGGNGWSLVWQNVPAGNYSLTARATDDDNATTTSASVAIAVQGSSSPTGQQLELQSGWNLVSSFIDPSSPGMGAVFADVVEDIVIVKDEAGQTYIPEFGINGIGNWEPSEAYMVYAQSDVTLTVEGEAIVPESTPLALSTGWNFVAYWRDASLPVTSALAAISGDIVLVKNNAGDVYIPEFGVNNIGSLQPGNGYKFYMERATNLVYPANAAAAKLASDPLAPHTAEGAVGIPASATLLVEAPTLKEGDEISAWAADGRVMGQGVVQEGRALITVRGDEPCTDTVEGAATGEDLHLKVLSAATGQQRELTVTSLRDGLQDHTLAEAALAYSEEAFLIVQVEEVPQTFRLEQNYPNPFNPETTITYSLPEEARVRLDVYNTLGQQVAVLVDGPQRAGVYDVRLDGAALSSGLYVYRLHAGGTTLTRKMLLLK